MAEHDIEKLKEMGGMVKKVYNNQIEDYNEPSIRETYKVRRTKKWGKNGTND